MLKIQSLLHTCSEHVEDEEDEEDEEEAEEAEEEATGKGCPLLMWLRVCVIV